MAVLASLATLSILVVLLLWRRDDVLTVALALLGVLCGVVTVVAVNAARYGRQPRETAAPQPYVPTPLGVDADTLDTLDSRDAMHAVNVRRRRASGLNDR
ncbi:MULTISPECIES: hypothetical protein [Micromonospora]|uniref:Uncharacterized protein n=1 Tax=Micromonospora yangpuensis TaxID=683228 RepID=A0A1C6VGN8_9ACTN|nr:hypothetical protein [Micromonospora yangpuensis]GGM31685.1 hypothetical protein GCM10012279_58220 [Micromonospora yangpuensis]SCL65060.1 hypothetical protein GA0070617_5644 [Micromonospora yangpuensis]